MTHATGDWTLRLLLLTLALTPLSRLSGWQWPGRLGRMLGLYAFFYATLHFSVYLWLDQFFDWRAIITDIAKRPFIAAGFASFLLLVPLAATSNQYLKNRLGESWRKLHRLAYLAALGGVIHFIWLVKKDITQPLIYGVILGLLLVCRALPACQRNRRAMR